MKKVFRSLKIDVLTLFPGMFAGPFSESLLAKAQEKGLLQIRVHDLRDYSEEPRRKVDDKPFGGGPGMVLKVEPIYNALKRLRALKKNGKGRKPCVIYLSPQGQPLDQDLAGELARERHWVLLCGRYEGIDERAMRWVDREVSIGDYVLTGGELPAMVLVDAAARLLPGVVQQRTSIENDSFYGAQRLDHSQYTRPAEFLGMKVPEVLLSGNHKAIESWRERAALENTARKRPDLIQK